MTIFKKNLEALKKYDKRLHDILRNFKPDPAYQVEPSANTDMPTLICKRGSKKHAITSTYDPSKQAKKIVGEFLENNKSENIIVLGLGLGYHIIELLSKKKNIFCVFEKDISIIFHAFSNMDLSEILIKKIPIITGDLELLNKNIINNTRAIILSKPDIFSYFPVTQDDIDYKEAEKIILSEIISIFESNAFLKEYPYISEKNIAKNFPLYCNSPGVKSLKNIFKGLPALVVASGPSLNASIELIKLNKNKFIIFSVDTSYKYLLHHDIEPHFVISNDIGKENFERHLKDVTGNAFYIAPPTIHNKSFDAFKNKTFMTDASTIGFQQWISKYLLSKGALNPATNSGCFAAGAAVYVGCNPVILTGVDLISESTKKHADGVFDSPSREENTISITDVLGNKRKTNRLWSLYHNDFENMVKNSPDTCFYQTSFGGALISGAHNKFIKEISENFTDIKKDICSIISEKISQNTYEKEHDKIKTIVKNIISDLQILNKIDDKIVFIENVLELLKKESLKEIIEIFAKNELVHVSSFLNSQTSVKNDISDLESAVEPLIEKIDFIKSLLNTMISK
ncbi:MAG: motility associated factor glycosyltransferase family protein [Candidatus Aureabacteria bacterium]|nr:motility associated factor glycosyltransferase family protein [Candidatus Auribacterota bacterium]